MMLWLAKVGRITVERVQVPHELVACDRSRPPAGVGHTTEGSFESALTVFREHYAPNFMVGRDARGRVRILQFVPIGYQSAALENHVGGGETNRWARAQIELVGSSSLQPWVPGPAVLEAFAGLLAALKTNAGIPLLRPFPDTLPAGTWATESNARRLSGKWGSAAGWFNHLEVPENDHWDMGAFQWRTAFAIAARAEIVAHRIEWSTAAGVRRAQLVKPTNLAVKAWINAHPLAHTHGKIEISRVRKGQ